MNPKPTSSMQSAMSAGGRSMRTPSASSTSAEPHREDIARLPCLAIGTPAAAATSAADVEMLKVSEPSPPVPQVSTRPSRDGVAGVACARMARAQPAISSGVSPFMRSATAKAEIWAGPASPAITCIIAACAASEVRSRPSTSVLIASVITRRPASPGSSRSAAGPRGVSTDSGWNWTPCTERSRWRTPITSPSVVRAVTSSAAGTSSAASEW